MEAKQAEDLWWWMEKSWEEWIQKGIQYSGNWIRSW